MNIETLFKEYCWLAIFWAILMIILALIDFVSSKPKTIKLEDYNCVKTRFTRGYALPGRWDSDKNTEVTWYETVCTLKDK
jgi:hypothetical protein